METARCLRRRRAGSRESSSSPRTFAWLPEGWPRPGDGGLSPLAAARRCGRQPGSRKSGLTPEKLPRLPADRPDLAGRRRVVAGDRPALRETARCPGSHADFPTVIPTSREPAHLGGRRRSFQGDGAPSGDVGLSPGEFRCLSGARGDSPGDTATFLEPRRCLRRCRDLSLSRGIVPSGRRDKGQTRKKGGGPKPTPRATTK